MADKPMTIDDVRQMLKDQRKAAIPAPAPDAPPQMTVDDVRRMLKGLPPLTDKEQVAAAKPPAPAVPRQGAPEADKSVKPAVSKAKE